MKAVDVFRDMTAAELQNLGPAGRAELVAEAEGMRIEAVKALGHVPPEVGPAVPAAPARGPVRMFENLAHYPAGEDGFEVKRAGYAGRKTLQRADSFDTMAAKAAGAGKAPPFTPAQVAMGRFYRDLVEKHACAGVRCSSLESLSQRSSGGGGGEYIDAVLRDRERISLLRHRIGAGSALVVRRQRPSERGSRAAIMDRRLVDIVCLEDGTITDVLRAHGWRKDAKYVKALREALGQVLDRMMGPVRGGGVSAVHFGSGCVPVWE